MQYRSGVVIVQDGKVALIRRKRQGMVYYLFPGGGVEEGETPEQAAMREAEEELGLQVQLARLLTVVTFKGTTQYYYEARVAGGVFGSGRGEELGFSEHESTGSYAPIWLPLSKLGEHDVRPAQLARALAQRAGGNPTDTPPSWPLAVDE